MNKPSDHYAQCFAQVQKLNQQHGWKLSESEAHELTSKVLPYLPANCSEARRSQGITAYYEDHQLVEALQHPEHPRHDEAWLVWRNQVTAILSHANLLWSRDYAVDSEDIKQIACTELAKSLPRFHYASRFSTWARTVVVQRIQRHVRDSLASKRAKRPESLDSSDIDTSALVDEHEQPTTHAEASILYNLIESLLADHPDQRLKTIYQLWFKQDQRIEDIGALIRVHPSRVRQLIGEMRTFLRAHPELQTWWDMLLPDEKTDDTDSNTTGDSDTPETD